MFTNKSRCRHETSCYSLSGSILRSDAGDEYCFDHRAADPVAPPGDIKLLPGYEHQKLQGIDTRVGKISKEGGITIQYDIGRLAGNATKGLPKADVSWIKEQTINGHPVVVAKTKENVLYVTFTRSSANFSAKVATKKTSPRCF